MDIPSLPQRISARIRLDDDTGCWIWTGATNRGYGQTKVKRRAWRLHRLVYTVLVRELSEAEVLDHLCRQKLCCNPAHLEPVTLAENSRRAGVDKRSEHCPKGHVKELMSGVWECRQCRRDKKATLWRDDSAYRQRKAAWKRARKRRPSPGQAPLF